MDMKERNSNIEALRVLAMVFIVISHYSVHGSIKSMDLEFGFNKFLIDSTNYGLIGVAIFVMITGYYLIESEFKVKRVVNIVLQTLFYTMGLFVIFCIFDNDNFSVINLFKNMFPVIGQRYWFVTNYVILCFLSPFINKMLNIINRKQFILLLIVITFYFIIAPSFFDLESIEITGKLGAIVVFYIFGAYLRKYPDNIFANKSRALIISVATFILLELSAIAIDVVGERFSAFYGKASKFYTINSILVLLLALGLLSFCINKTPKYSRLVNTLGGCTFGVYLIHDNNYMREYLWGNIFDNSKYAESNYLIVHFFLSVSIVYVACTVIEYIRKYVLEKYVFKNIINRINSCADSIYSRLLSLIEKR